MMRASALLIRAVFVTAIGLSNAVIADVDFEHICAADVDTLLLNSDISTFSPAPVVAKMILLTRIRFGQAT